jgi:hypothetical protein
MPVIKIGMVSGEWVQDADKVDGFHASLTPAPNTIPVANSSNKIADGWLNFVANDPKVKTALNASGNAPIYACRAWVNFDGTTNPPTIRGSGNVSSVTKNGTGDFTVNFIIPMNSANYAVAISFGNSPLNSSDLIRGIALTSSSCRFVTMGYNGVYVDLDNNFLIALGG